MTSLVFTGEGSKFGFQMAAALREESHGREFSEYYGISSGALASFLMSYIERDAIRAVMSQIRGRSDVFSLRWDFLWKDGIFKSDPLERKISYLYDNARRIPAKVKPAYLNVCHFEKGYIETRDISKLSRIDVIQTVVEAITIPGVVSPTYYPYVDAGVLEINPVSYAIQNGSKDVLIIMGRPMMSHEFKRPTGPLGFALMGYRAIDLMMHEMCVDDILGGGLNDEDAAVKLLEPNYYLGGAFDFHRTKDFWDIGEAGSYKITDVVEKMRVSALAKVIKEKYR